MAIQLVGDPIYTGQEGINHIRDLRSALHCAVDKDDWDEVRRLDQICMKVIDKVIEAHKGKDKSSLLTVLDEIKDAYYIMIVQCKREVASTAH